LKKLILFIILLLLSVSLASADYQTDAISCWSFDNADTSRPTSSDYANNMDLTIFGTATGLSGKFSEAYGFGDGNNYTYNNTVPLNIDTNGSVTMNVWVNGTTGSDYQQIFGRNTASIGTSDASFFIYRNGGVYGIKSFDGSGNNAEITNFSSYVGDGEWHMLTGVYDEPSQIIAIYVDGVYRGNTSSNANIDLNDNGATFWIGGTSQPYPYDGIIDEGTWYNRSLSSGDITELWNSGTGYSCADIITGPVSKGSLNMSNTGPSNNTQFSTTTLNFNVSFNASYVFNCTHYINGLINSTRDNNSVGTNIALDFNISFSSDDESTYTYQFKCDDGETKPNSTQKTFYIDNVQPTINWYTPASDNSTILNIYDNSNLSTNISIVDNNLYSYYYNITNFDGTVLISYNNTTLTGETTYTITDKPDMIGYTGVHRSVVEVCDGHTNNEINFGARKKNNELVFDDVNIYLNEKSDTGSYGFLKTKDRYRFNFITKTSNKHKSFIVESDKFIDILNEKSEYPGHLITGNKWIDFDMSYLERVTVNRISSKKVLVNVYSKKNLTRWNFNSIGELNCQYDVKGFFVYNITTGYDDNLLTTESHNHNLTLNYNSSYINSLSANLIYNGTTYAATGSQVNNDYVFSYTTTAPVVSQESNITFYWDYTINSVNYNTSTQKHTVYAPLIDNCSKYNTPFMNITILDELNDTELYGSANYIFEYSYNSYSGIYNNSQSTTGVNDSTFMFCIYPSFANFTTDITFQYSVTGYDTRDYVTTETVIDNNTDQITLYSIESGKSTAINLHVVDGDDNNLENVFIESYRWDIPTNTDKLVETKYTDSDGNAEFNLKSGSEYYSFKFYQGGELKLSTNRFQLFTTSYEYVITEGVSSNLAKWVQYDTGISRTLTYNNVTNIVKFSFDTNLSEISQFCLEVNDPNGSSFSDHCTTNTSGSLTYLVTVLNQSYNAIGQVVSADSGVTFNLITLFIDTSEGWDRFAPAHRLFISFVVFLVVAMFGLISKDIAIVSAILALIILQFFGVLGLPAGWLITIVIVGIILLIVMNRRQV